MHAPSRRVDLEFVRAMDPGLAPAEPHGRPARLALHFLRRRKTFFETGGRGVPWADPVECLLDLYEAGLDVQAKQFQMIMSDPGRTMKWPK